MGVSQRLSMTKCVCVCVSSLNLHYHLLLIISQVETMLSLPNSIPGKYLCPQES